MVNLGFWSQLNSSTDGPILCLAPMADVTDSAFRFIISKYSKDKSTPRSLGQVGFVTFTEFVSADGLVRAPEVGRNKLLKDLEYTEIERPIVAQFFTSRPEMMEKAAALALELGFDGVDINMGCPDRNVEKQGAGASLIKTPNLAKEIIAAAKQGAKHLPVSVKTRLGYNTDELEGLARPNDNLGGWLSNLLEAEPAVITIHARTRKEMSKVPARWERIKRAAEIRNESKSKTLIFGNGDVVDVDDARRKWEETGCDGVMLGRAIFGNPYLFANFTHAERGSKIEHPDRSVGATSPKQKLLVLVEHTKLFEKNLGGVKNFAVMKKHFKSYLKNIDGSGELSKKLMETTNASEVEALILDFIKNLSS